MIRPLKIFVVGISLWLAATGAIAGFSTNQLVGFWAKQVAAAGGACGASGVTFLSSNNNADQVTPATVTAADLGTACDDRIIVVAVGTADDDGLGTFDVTSMTIGGVSATERVSRINTAGTIDSYISMWTAVVPSGATGDITFEWAGDTDDNIGVGWWRVVSVDDADGVPSDSDSAVDAGPLNTVTIPSSGVAIFACTTTEEGGISMSNAGTERFDLDLGTDGGLAGYDGATAGTTPSVVCTSALAEAYAGVAFGP